MEGPALSCEGGQSIALDRGFLCPFGERGVL